MVRVEDTAKHNNAVTSFYGVHLGRMREECDWPIVDATPKGKDPSGFFMTIWGSGTGDDRLNWPRCRFCFLPPSYDRLRRVGCENVCYACFDVMRYRVAQIIRATLGRFLLGQFLPTDVTLRIYNLLYCLMLK